MKNRESFNKAAGMLGARRDDTGERAEHDFYATEPVAIEKLIKLETLNKRIWEPACGQGHLSKPLVREGFDVRSTDLIYRGYGEGGVDFLQQQEKWDGDIITNPPYNLSERFVEHALQIIPAGCKACFFLKLTFLEGQARKDFFTIYPPRTVWVSSSRIQCGKNGNFEGCSSMMAQAWFIWQKGYQGETTVKWF